MRTVEFTDEEIAALRQMLEVALKAVGRPAIAAFVALDKKLAEAPKKDK